MNKTNNPYARLIAKAWANEAFKKRLTDSPLEVMKEEGFNIPEGVKVRILEDSESEVHLVIPSRPSSEEMSEQDLGALTWAYESNSGPSGGSRAR